MQCVSWDCSLTFYTNFLPSTEKPSYQRPLIIIGPKQRSQRNQSPQNDKQTVSHICMHSRHFDYTLCMTFQHPVHTFSNSPRASFVSSMFCLLPTHNVLFLGSVVAQLIFWLFSAAVAIPRKCCLFSQILTLDRTTIVHTSSVKGMTSAPSTPFLSKRNSPRGSQSEIPIHYLLPNRTRDIKEPCLHLTPSVSFLARVKSTSLCSQPHSHPSIAFSPACFSSTRFPPIQTSSFSMAPPLPPLFCSPP